MQNSIDIEICLFGAFRKFDNGTPIVLRVPAGSCFDVVRKGLCSELTSRYPEFNQQSLIYESPFADEKSILSNNFCLEKDIKLAILPPVCGG